MSLLDDIELDYHADRLANGNLRGEKARETRSSNWTGENSWTSEGYIMRAQCIKCSGCSTETYILQGIFHKEKSSSGATREQRLNETKLLQFPDNSAEYSESLQTVRICYSCAPTPKGL